MNLYAPALGRSIYFALPVYDIRKILSFLNKKIPVCALFEPQTGIFLIFIQFRLGLLPRPIPPESLRKTDISPWDKTNFPKASRGPG